jgi:methylenetetrahydrofolate dehydrogenase (NADP+) / methenyltetrahydrofolate cyclohydrolase
MAAKLLNGSDLAKRMKTKMKAEVEAMKTIGLVPGLAVVIVGDNPASRSYVTMKERDCAEVGIRSLEFALPVETPEHDLLELVDRLNADDGVHGILVQLPLPPHMNEARILERISPAKDADAFHPQSAGKLLIGIQVYVPCTPAGVMALLEDAGIGVAGKECVVAGRSNIVGKPMALLLLQADGTVTICHSKTKNLKEVCSRADILVVAIGRAKMIDASYVKEGAVVIDVGASRDSAGKMVGDVDFESVSGKASWITPVPGGVGPMTRAMLLSNTLKAARISVGKDAIS